MNAVPFAVAAALIALCTAVSLPFAHLPPLHPTPRSSPDTAVLPAVDVDAAVRAGNRTPPSGTYEYNVCEVYENKPSRGIHRPCGHIRNSFNFSCKCNAPGRRHRDRFYVYCNDGRKKWSKTNALYDGDYAGGIKTVREHEEERVCACEGSK